MVNPKGKLYKQRRKKKKESLRKLSLDHYVRKEETHKKKTNNAASHGGYVPPTKSLADMPLQEIRSAGSTGDDNRFVELDFRR